NYWGYNTLGYFAPHAAYSSSGARGEQVREFKAMVRALHAAGIEVILDVVYNHTAEGDQLGPTLSLRGIDNPTYYRLRDDDPRLYLDYTGTGNTLNARQPHVLQLIMDSLRYWVTEMHVDGFRFDLAAALARSFHDVDKLSAFFDIIQQDPVLSRVKLIAEPWDLGPGGYLVGEFPPLWTEWNGKYRDTVRDFWRGAETGVAELGYRLSGSSDFFAREDRGPCASVNFITAHDGFTLEDLFSYNDKHNEANGEDNRDGHSNNRSWNCGVEGSTDDEAINELRERQKRNLVATLFLSQGIPMLLAGDEVGRTQLGNNNAYCQDNEITWVDWNWDEKRWKFLEVAKRVIRLRKEHTIFHRRHFFTGAVLQDGRKDVTWLKPDGEEMTQEEWDKDFARSLGMWLNGEHLSETDERGHPLKDASFLVLFNAHDGPIEFRLPKRASRGWRAEIDTHTVSAIPQLATPGDTYPLQGRSLVVLREIEASGL
ncbi:MAG: glycogen debranching protein GlgX, partial [Bacillota bacterium]